MKASSKLTKKDPSKNDLTSNRESESSTNGGGSTPEITARSRRSLREHAGRRQQGRWKRTRNGTYYYYYVVSILHITISLIPVILYIYILT